MSNNPAIYEVISKQHLRAILGRVVQSPIKLTQG